MTHLWSPTTVGRLELEHRLAMAPMSRNRAQPDGSPTSTDAVYFAQRASLGLLVTGGTYPSEEAQGHLLLHGIYTDAHVAGWREVTRAVHDAGGHLVIQLMHPGRHAHPTNIIDGRQPVAPSPIAPGVSVFTASGMRQAPVPRALSTQEVRATVDGFRRGAARAIEAGADGVEIHAGNGLLIQQFLAESSNRRTDAYGGSLLNRTRFAIEVATAIASEIGADRTGIRIEPKLTRNGIDEGADVDELYRILLAELSRLDLAYLHLVHPGDEEDLARTRTSWRSALLLNRPGLARDSIGADVTAGLADVAIVGRWALANPDLVRRLQLGAPLNEPDCTTFYGGDQHGYTDYPSLDERRQVRDGVTIRAVGVPEKGGDVSGPGVIESAFGLLELLRALGRARLAELTKESGLPRTTVRRLLGQLTAVGAVERIGPHYRLGPNLLSLGQHVTPLERLRAVAQRPLIELAAATPAHVGLVAMAATAPIYLDVLLGRGRLPFRREPGEPAPSGSAGARLLRSGVPLTVDDGGSIDGVSCAAHALPLPGGDVACVGVVVPLPRLPRGLLAPLRATTSRIATLLAAHPAELL